MTTSRIWTRSSIYAYGFPRGTPDFYNVSSIGADSSLGPNPVLLRTQLQVTAGMRINTSDGFGDSFPISTQVQVAIKWSDGIFPPGMTPDDEGEGVIGIQLLTPTVWVPPSSTGGYDILWTQPVPFDVKTMRRSRAGEGGYLWMYVRALDALGDFSIAIDPSQAWMVWRFDALWGN